jgi:hypothetical protein
MAATQGLIARLAPDCIARLRRAAGLRFEEAGALHGKYPLAAVYWYGYIVEMCLVSAYFRNAGFLPNMPIDRDTRIRRMAHARQNGLMKSDPHPLPGWANLLRWQSSLAKPGHRSKGLLDEAVHRANAVYRHWRPELRYKTTDVKPEWLEEVRRAARWFLDNHSRL